MRDHFEGLPGLQDRIRSATPDNEILSCFKTSKVALGTERKLLIMTHPHAYGDNIHNHL